MSIRLGGSFAFYALVMGPLARTRIGIAVMGVLWLFMAAAYFVNARIPSSPVLYPALIGWLFVGAAAATFIFAWKSESNIAYAAAGSFTLVAWLARLYGITVQSIEVDTPFRLGTIINQSVGVTSAMLGLAVIYGVVLSTVPARSRL